MARAAVLAACLLAMAAGIAAQPFPVTGCTGGHLKLEFVAPKGSNDPIAKCLTSARLELDSDCRVTLTPLSSFGSSVPGFWSGEPLLTSGKRDIECPATARAPIQAMSNFKTITNVGQKLEGVRRAVIKAFASHVYGLNAFGEYNNEIRVPDLDFKRGVLMVKRTDEYNVMYAITENTITDINDVRQDDDKSPLDLIRNCTDLEYPIAPYDEAALLCRGNEIADEKCEPNSYQVMMVPDLNEDDEKDTAFKVCGLCPAGTHGDGFGCSTCPAGSFSQIGEDCKPCPAGTYSNAGSSVCIPCPAGTYAPGEGTAECKECPEDTYTWIPGATSCLRCLQGVPEACDADGECPSGVPEAGVRLSSPATMIASVSRMIAADGTCNLVGDMPYEIPAYTKCSSWKAASPVLQLAFRVAGDCSIQISPITDESCADPTDPVTAPDSLDYDAAVHPYGKIEMRGYYHWDAPAGKFVIRSLFGVQIDDHEVKDKAVMLAIDTAAGGKLTMKFFGATTNAETAAKDPIIADLPDSNPEVCFTTLTVTGGTLIGVPTPADEDCPAGSYFDSDEYCPACPVGYTCPGGEPEEAKIVPCPPNQYNPFLGFSGDCQACPEPVGPGTYTSYAAAQQCDVERVDLTCDSDEFKDSGKSWAYDLASQECQLCAAGTFRDYAGSTECEPCPPGTYSAEGDETCTDCPLGQYNPLEGLADQTSITGIPCVLCAEGSMPMSDSSLTASVDTPATKRSTFCDACPAGTWLPDPTEPCQECLPDSYRSGDATPENNVCKPIPPGYKLKTAGDHTEIDLCPQGQVSFYSSRNQDDGVRVPFNKEAECQACADLDAELGEESWAHTFAPRKGMTQCVPCPAGTIPNTVGDVDSPTRTTASCKACPNGTYRDAYLVSATCTDCPAGYEVGPSSKMQCNQCRPGSFMDKTRADRTDQLANTCDLCPIHTYRPTFGATSCLPCPRGTQTSNVGNVECTACPVGYHNNQAGTICEAAPAGTFVNTTGAYVSTPCPKGSWNNEEAQDNCNPCAPGKYSNTLGSKECKTCGAGTFSAGQASSCKDCRPGYFAPAGASACSPCKPGTYAPEGKSATCKMCPKGYQCPTNAMKLVGPCPRGTFSNKEGNKQCTPCPINTYALGGGSAQSPRPVMACIKCAPGTDTRGRVGQSKCQVKRPQVKRLF